MPTLGVIGGPCGKLDSLLVGGWERAMVLVGGWELAMLFLGGGKLAIVCFWVALNNTNRLGTMLSLLVAQILDYNLFWLPDTDT